MDAYAARLLCAAMMIGIAALGATLFGSAEVQTEDPRPMIAIAAEKKEQSSTPAEQTYFIALRCDAPETGGVLELCDADGRVVQTFLAQARELTAGPFAPGSYSVWNAYLGTVSFILTRNASLLVTDGNGWTDGEVLHLCDGRTGSASVTVRALTAMLPEEGIVTTISLQNEADGNEVYRTLVLEKQVGYQSVQTLHFEGLAAGVWQLCRDGTALQSVELRADAANELVLDIAP